MKKTSQAFIKPYVTEKYIYAANLLGNSVKSFFRIDRETYEVKLLSLLSGEKTAKSNEHRAVFEYKGKCFIFSFHNYDVISYDLTTGEEMYYSPGEEYFFQYIQSIIQIQDQVWIFQDVLNPLIMVFSLTTYTYEKREVDLSLIRHRD